MLFCTNIPNDYKKIDCTEYVSNKVILRSGSKTKKKWDKKTQYVIHKLSLALINLPADIRLSHQSIS